MTTAELRVAVAAALMVLFVMAVILLAFALTMRAPNGGCGACAGPIAFPGNRSA